MLAVDREPAGNMGGPSLVALPSPDAAAPMGSIQVQEQGRRVCWVAFGVLHESDVGQFVLQASSWSEFGPWASSWNRQHLSVPLVLLCPGEMQERQVKQLIPRCRSPSQIIFPGRA